MLFSQPPTSIEVMSKMGRFTTESSDIPGDSWNPKAKLTDDEMVNKFKNNASYVLDDAQINRIVEAIDGLDKLKDINELTVLLAP